MDHAQPEKLRPRQMVVRYVAGDGRNRFHGGAHLKGSQSYPAGSMAGCLGNVGFQGFSFPSPWLPAQVCLVSLVCIMCGSLFVGCLPAPPFVLSSALSLARFGYALSKVRTSNRKRNYRLAVDFLRRAKKTTNDFDTRKSTNRLWTKHADLQSLIDFLSTTESTTKR